MPPRCSNHRRSPGRTAELALSEADLTRLAAAFARTRGRDPTLDEIARLDAWATRTRTHALLLPLVLQGELAIDLDERDGIVFAPTGQPQTDA